MAARIASCIAVEARKLAASQTRLGCESLTFNIGNRNRNVAGPEPAAQLRYCTLSVGCVTRRLQLRRQSKRNVQSISVQLENFQLHDGLCVRGFRTVVLCSYSGLRGLCLRMTPVGT